MNPHIALLCLNISSISLILVAILVLIFHSKSPRGSAKAILISLMSLGMFVRLSALYITMVLLRSNGVG